MRAFHGTNQDFEAFLATPPRRNTGSDSARVGTFFTLRKQTASDYAVMAAGKFWPGDHEAFEARVRELTAQAEAAMAKGRFEQGERLYELAEQLERDGREICGMVIYEVEIDARNPVTLDARDMVDHTLIAGVLQDAFDRGHDAVVLDQIYEPVSASVETQIVVRDPARVTIVGREMVEERADEHDAAPASF